MDAEEKKKPMYDDDLCSQFFVMFISGKQGFRNKVLGLMTDFFEGHWASRTSPNHLKKGFNAERTFQEQDIIWFQAEVLKLIEQELGKDTTKLQKLFDERSVVTKK